jgi:hypothetical protein
MCYRRKLSTALKKNIVVCARKKKRGERIEKKKEREREREREREIEKEDKNDKEKERR